VALSLLAAECLALARTSGEPRDLALALLMPALEAAVRGDQGSASSLSQECARAAREARDPWLLAWALLVHGNEAQASGDDQRARLLFTQGLIPAEESGDRWVRGILRCNVASLELRQGRAGRASALYKQALAAFREMGERTLVANAVEGLAGVAACRGCPERAARLLGAMAAYRETIGYPVEALERPHYERQLAACRCALGEAAFAAAFAEGRAMPLERAVEHALEEA
jgi:ATP/maltotriose-dependent transcriptional regulator MalT